MAKHEIPSVPSKEFSEDIFGAASIMVLAPCVADITKIRLIAHLSENMRWSGVTDIAFKQAGSKKRLTHSAVYIIIFMYGNTIKKIKGESKNANNKRTI